MHSQLSKAQKEAVMHKDGPMMVLAGPGSGKTLVITKRIQYLISHYQIPPQRILVITFTRAAANEMKERFWRLAGETLPVSFGTFHSVFFTILKYAYHYSADNILPEHNKYDFIREIITDHELEIDDEADFLTSDEEESLSEVMYETAGYCNAMVVTTTYHTFSSTEDFAVSTYENYFGKNSSGIVFVIDRDLNEIYLASEGDARKKITDSKCDVICDNTYVYATKDHGYDYYTCAVETFDQINTSLAGGRIAQPMKYVSNIFLAVALGMFVCFIYTLFVSKSRRPSRRELLSGSFTKVDVQNPNAQFMYQDKKYSPQSSGSSGGNSGGHSSGGHSGGGHSGGGHHI